MSSINIHELTGKVCNSHKRALAYVAATALATTAISVPVTALAEEAPAAPAKDDAKQATTDTQQQAPTDSYKVTQTVEKDEKTFDTKDDAQKYLDNATQKTTDMGKADTKSTYGIKTTGPTQVTKDTTHEEKSDVTSGSQDGFATQKDAEDWVKDQTSSYKDTDDTKYTTSVTVTPKQTGTKTETTEGAHSGSQDGFATQKAAEDWVKDQTKGYKDTDDTTYTVHPSYQNNPTTEKDGNPVQVDSKTTTSQEFDSKADAEAALQKDKDADPSTDLHKVSFSNVEEKTTVVKPESTQTDTYQSDDYMTAKNRDAAMEYEIKKLEADGWTVIATTSDTDPSATIGRCFTKIDHSWSKYRIPAGTYVIVKQATWYALWTPEPVSDDVTNQIKDLINWGDRSTRGKDFYSGNYGFDTDFQHTGTQGAGRYQVHDNGDGSYTVYASCSKISHLDYGCIKYQPGEYSFKLDLSRKVPAVTKTTYHYTKTVTDYTQPTKTVDHWKASYSVDETTVTPVYEYVASYKVSQTKTVPDTGWKAGYEITKTTEYAPKPDNPTPETPETPKTPEAPATKASAETPKATPAAPATVKTAAVKKSAPAKSEAKAALPKTGDSSANAVAAVAAMGAAIAALGLSLRRKGQRN